MGIPGGINSALAAGHDVFTGLQIGIAGKIGQFDQRTVQRPAGADDAHVVRLVFHPRRNTAIRIAEQSHLRARVTDGRNAPHQAVSGQHGQIFTESVPAAEVNLHGAPPIRRVSQDDVGEFEFPWRLPLPAEERAQLVVFTRDGGGLQSVWI